MKNLKSSETVHLFLNMQDIYTNCFSDLSWH